MKQRPLYRLPQESEMRPSYLIQRLEKPNFLRKPDGTIVDNPFNFGCVKNGGLSDQAMAMLRGVFGFEYMGAAEFEFGAVPKALSAMAKEELTTAKVTVKTSSTFRSWDKGKAGVCEAPVFILCPKKQVAEITKRIEGMGDERSLRTCEHVGLEDSIRLIADGQEANTLGWLELSNGYFFFVDKEMWKKVCALFEVKAND